MPRFRLCRVCSFPMDNPKNVIHYRTCVRRRDWPSWVRNGTAPVETVAATPSEDGREPAPFPPLVPVPDPEPEPAYEPVPAGAMMAFSPEGTILCPCGKISADNRAHSAHLRTSKLHRELVSA